MEKEMIGLYISGYPTDEYIPRAPDDCMYIADALLQPENRTLSILGVLTEKKSHHTKNGKTMAFTSFEDCSAQTECIISHKHVLGPCPGETAESNI